LFQKFINVKTKNGKIDQKYNPYPKCSAHCVCLIPVTVDDNIKNCFIVESKIYCSANYSNIEACQSGNKDYDLRQCVREVGELFTDFKYSFISNATIIPPPPSSTKTKITLNPIFISKPTKTIIKPTPIIRRPTESLVPRTDPVELPIKTRIISEPIPTMKPFPTVRPTARPTLHPIIIDDEKK